MNLSAVKQIETAENLLLLQLKEKQAPMSLQELLVNLAQDTNLSHRTLKEAAWKLVEKGKAQFNSTWDLEIR